MKVRDVMTTDVRAVAVDAPLKDVAELFIAKGISGAPVVDGAGIVVGVVSETDILFKERPAGSDEGALARVLHRGRTRGLDAKHNAQTAGEAMSAPPIAVRPGTDIAGAVALMLGNRVNRLPVVDDGERAGPVGPGTLVGILTRADLVRAFARLDSELAPEIDQIVRARQQLWARSPDDVSYTVDRGRVLLKGTVDFRTHAELLVAEVEAVPGVVSITSELSWNFDEPPRNRDVEEPTR